jgi:hypothetical protein
MNRNYDKKVLFDVLTKIRTLNRKDIDKLSI